MLLVWPASMLAHPFMRHAFLAGTAVALVCGLVGFFVVLRGQVFTGDALSHVAFTGALAALAAGVDLRLGLFGATVAVGLAMGLLGRAGRADDVVIGSVFVWMLGLGVLFLSIFTSSQSGANGTAGVSVLFGSIFGLSRGDAWFATLTALIAALAVLLIARPLLFASLDGSVAVARGVPVRVLGVVFLGIVGITAAETTQAVGALLLLGLLAAPAAAAQQLTARPYRGLLLSAVLSLASMWCGLTLSYAIPKVPPSFAIIAVAVVGYGLASIAVRTGVARTTAGPIGLGPARRREALAAPRDR